MQVSLDILNFRNDQRSTEFKLEKCQGTQGNFHCPSVARSRCPHPMAQPLLIQGIINGLVVTYSYIYLSACHLIVQSQPNQVRQMDLTWSDCSAVSNHRFCVCGAGFGAEESWCGCSRGDHRRGLSLHLQCPVCLRNPGTHTPQRTWISQLLLFWVPSTFQHHSASPAHVLHQ